MAAGMDRMAGLAGSISLTKRQILFKLLKKLGFSAFTFLAAICEICCFATPQRLKVP
jgi:hypothetical protein